ncbi:hypothetical protein ABZU45_39575 [Streptomyces avermitilis]
MTTAWERAWIPHGRDLHVTDESTSRSPTVVMHPHKLCELAVTPA